jgi:hypothetical protein
VSRHIKVGAQATVSVGVRRCTVVTKPVHHRRNRFGPCAIVSFASLAAMPYQFCPLEHHQVLGDSRLGHARTASQCVDGLFAPPSQRVSRYARVGLLQTLLCN